MPSTTPGARGWRTAACYARWRIHRWCWRDRCPARCAPDSCRFSAAALRGATGTALRDRRRVQSACSGAHCATIVMDSSTWRGTWLARPSPPTASHSSLTAASCCASSGHFPMAPRRWCARRSSSSSDFCPLCRKAAHQPKPALVPLIPAPRGDWSRFSPVACVARRRAGRSTHLSFNSSASAPS